MGGVTIKDPLRPESVSYQNGPRPSFFWSDINLKKSHSKRRVSAAHWDIRELFA